MPYTPPSLSTNHSRNNHTSFTNEHGEGAFASLGALPRPVRRSLPAFHFVEDTYDSSGESEEESSSQAKRSRRAPGLRVDTSRPIPFPRTQSSPPSSPRAFQGSQLPNRSSSVVFLSNGKPLKSSLKSPCTSSAASGHSAHVRARSAPSTPSLGLMSSSSSSSSDEECDSGATTPKSVHFDDHLETVQTFKRSGKPAHLLSLSDTETESEAPETFPFPRVPLFSPTYTLHADPIPARLPVREIILESVQLVKLRLVGSIVVKNVSYVKDVTVRFTLDDWRTTSEVLGDYRESLEFLPPSLAGAREIGSCSWDRFAFVIKLEDYASTLAARTLYLAARYAALGDQWWDNNAGKDYCLRFVRETTSTPPPTFHTELSALPVDPFDRNRVNSAKALEKRLRRFTLTNYAKPTWPSPLGATNTDMLAPSLSRTKLSSGSLSQARLSPPSMGTDFSIPATTIFSSLPRVASPPSPLKEGYKTLVEQWCYVGGVGA